jgi:hypothetical protein
MLETADDVQVLEIDGKLHFIADGDLTGESALELERSLEGLTRGDVMVIGDQPCTVIVYSQCATPILIEVKGQIFDKLVEA